jgi:hypothetical protein
MKKFLLALGLIAGLSSGSVVMASENIANPLAGISPQEDVNTLARPGWGRGWRRGPDWRRGPGRGWDRGRGWGRGPGWGRGWDRGRGWGRGGRGWGRG